MKGLVQIYTGNGKGKTTAAVGLGIRAYGSGLKVLMVQFLKGAETGELKVLNTLAPDFRLYRSKKIKGFIWNMNEDEKQELGRQTREAFDLAVKAVKSGEWDMLILDELMGAISNKLISVEAAVALIKNKPEKLEIVMTGRNAPPELVSLADYVSDIAALKHPMDMGITARKGIEY